MTASEGSAGKPPQPWKWEYVSDCCGCAATVFFGWQQRCLASGATWRPVVLRVEVQRSFWCSSEHVELLSLRAKELGNTLKG